MMQLPAKSLDTAHQHRLDKYQAEINAIVDYEQCVAAAKTKFSARNTSRNATFRHIKSVLEQLCSGARRCMYCEDSYADEVEHIRPKDIYPELVFVWENYLYACGPCNGPKNNQFAVFAYATGQQVEVTRRRGAAVVPPEPGDPLLIDPRCENPLDFIELDLAGTFFFLEIGQPSSREYIRAEYTILVLRLNDRDHLVAARQEAFRNFCARLREYIHMRDENSTQQELDEYVLAVQNMGHPTVWAEMKRQRLLYPILKTLFEQAPEALTW